MLLIFSTIYTSMHFQRTKNVRHLATFCTKKCNVHYIVLFVINEIHRWNSPIWLYKVDVIKFPSTHYFRRGLSKLLRQQQTNTISLILVIKEEFILSLNILCCLTLAFTFSMRILCRDIFLLSSRSSCENWLLFLRKGGRISWTPLPCSTSRIR